METYVYCNGPDYLTPRILVNLRSRNHNYAHMRREFEKQAKNLGTKGWKEKR